MRVKNTAKHINIITLGCSKNLCDSEAMAGQLTGQGFSVSHEGEGDIVVINTCGFIGDAKEESINAILEQIDRKKKGQVSRVYVTGCLAQRYRSELEESIPEVDGYYGVKEMRELLMTLGADYKKELVGQRLLST
ncbi:MAG: 30S ribosomal protein S12 methylthiotransferase RimO, partial [Flavobacteriales bacterium]|nr:30S ribosomal protein S12 methylthiotransferase RimO [Flavobacteriales bacterium]